MQKKYNSVDVVLRFFLLSHAFTIVHQISGGDSWSETSVQTRLRGPLPSPVVLGKAAG